MFRAEETIMRQTTAPRARIRILILECDDYTDSLMSYCEATGRRFFFRDATYLSHFPGCTFRQGRGKLFEFFPGSMDLEALMGAVYGDDCRSRIEGEFFFMNPPVLVCRRRGEPADMLRPYEEYLPILDQLPVTERAKPVSVPWR